MFGVELIVLIIVGGIILAGVVGMAARAQMRAIAERWTQAAEMLGFALAGKGFRPSISGTDGNLRAKVDVYSQSSGESQTTYTRYRIEYKSLGLGLRLSKQTGWHGVLKAFGAQDLEVGDATFDANFVVKARNTEAVRRFLTSGRMMSLNRLLAVHGGVVVSDDEIKLETSGLVRDPEVIVSTVRRLMSVAHVLADEGAAAELDPIVENRLAGVVETPTDPGDITTANMERALLEAEDLEISGKREEARDLFAALEAELPADPEVAGWADRAESVAAPLDSGTDRDPLALATRLFGDDQLSFEVAAIFDQEYRDRPVEWSGVVRREAGLSASKAFTDGPHSVLVIDVASIEHDLYGNASVDAVVAFPPDSSLPDRGDPVRFTGRLIAVDGLTRNLFVADASINAADAP